MQVNEEDCLGGRTAAQLEVGAQGGMVRCQGAAVNPRVEARREAARPIVSGKPCQDGRGQRAKLMPAAAEETCSRDTRTAGYFSSAWSTACPIVSGDCEKPGADQSKAHAVRSGNNFAERDDLVEAP